MLNFGNKEFRNLQEQVAKNQEDIAALAAGLQIVGIVSAAANLPTTATNGVAYLVGTAVPYNLYIYLNSVWQNLGEFPAPGAQGIQGEKGDTATIGSVNCETTTLTPGSSATASAVVSGTNIVFTFEIPQGLQGIKGDRGPQGIQGEQGIQGKQGERGETAYGVEIIGVINDTSLLPDPKTVSRNAGYLVGSSAPYNLYLIIGIDNLQWLSVGGFSPNTLNVDNFLSIRSTNPVQNKIITNQLELINNKLDTIFVSERYTSMVGPRGEFVPPKASVHYNIYTDTGSSYTMSGETNIDKYSIANGAKYAYLAQVLDMRTATGTFLAGFWQTSSSPGTTRATMNNISGNWYGAIATSNYETTDSSIFCFQFLNTDGTTIPKIVSLVVLDLSEYPQFNGMSINQIFNSFNETFWERLSYKGSYSTELKINPESILIDNEPLPTVIDGINDKLIVDKDVVSMEYSQLLNNTVSDGIFNSTGGGSAYSGARISDYLPIVPNTDLAINMQFIGRNRKCVVLYNANKEVIKYFPESSMGGDGVWSDLSITTTVPADARYLRYCVRKNYTGSFPVSLSFTRGDISVSQFLRDLKVPGEQWKNKKWYAFGTSITDTGYLLSSGNPSGKYVPYLADLSGMKVVNNGIAGGTIGRGGRFGGSGNILDRILQTDVSSADLITIEGFVNDFACAVPLGKPGDTENNTMFGALYQAVKYCQENSNAVVVLLTDNTGKQHPNGDVMADYSFNTRTVVMADGSIKTQDDYNDVIRQAAKFMGCYCIDAGPKSGINCFHPDFLEDWIHQSYKGGEQYANTIWSELKDIELMPVKD